MRNDHRTVHPRTNKLAISAILTWDKTARIYRLIRFVKNSEPHTGRKFTIGLVPHLFRWKREYSAWILVVLCVRFHYSVSHGGCYAE